MTFKSIATLATCALLLSFPLLAQEPAQEEPAPESTQVTETQDPQSTGSETGSVELQASTEEAEVSASSEEGEMQASAQIESEDPQATANEDERELPQTASPLAFLALLGLGGLGAAGLLRVFRRK